MAKDNGNQNHNDSEIKSNIENELNRELKEIHIVDNNTTNLLFEIEISSKDIANNSNGGTPEPPSKREDNPFSLKHFLNRDQSNSSSLITPGIGSISTTTLSNSNNPTTLSYQNTTGARPKILQQNDGGPPTTTNAGIRDILNMPNLNSQQQQQHRHSQAVNKMKRSPRFPSFDSQASLNEYKHDDRLSMTNLFHSRSNTSFTSSNSCGIGGGIGNSIMGCNIDVNEEYSPNHEFQRSFSNYDIEPLHHSALTTSPRNDRRKNRSSSSAGGRNSEFSSALPDFVQDHLVVEQLYNAFGNSPPASTSPLTVDDGGEQDSDYEDLISRVRPEIISLPSASCNDIPFDLTYNSSNGGRTSRTRNSPVPLDLPTNRPPDIPLDLPSAACLNINRRDGRRNPLSSADLTLDLTGTINGSRNSPAFAADEMLDSMFCDNNKIQTLPDFLSDGPIHSSGRLADVAQDLPSHLNHHHHHHHHHIDSPDDETTIMSRLRLENDRLKQELDESRRVLSERNRRINELERVIDNERKNEYKYTTTLAHSMVQVEENLDRSNKRAAAAQSLANQLKQQVKQLTAEVETLRRDNYILKEESGGAVGGSGIRAYPQNRSSRTQQFSRELLQAASTAENNLKQLLTGVDNLRLMAAKIENMDRLNDRNEDYQDECDTEDDIDCTGPAL